MKVFGVVYLIWNMVNGKKYVGQTVQPLNKRFNHHASCKKMLIGKAIRKYGVKNFHYGVIKSCASKEEMDYWKKYFIVALKTKSPYGYNLTDGGEGTIGYSFTDEHCAKLTEISLGEKNHRYGKRNTPEHQARIVASNLGVKRTPEACANISAGLKGKSFTVERCSNISIATRYNSPYKNLIAELDANHLTYATFAKLLNLSRVNVSRKMRAKENSLPKIKSNAKKFLTSRLNISSTATTIKPSLPAARYPPCVKDIWRW